VTATREEKRRDPHVAPDVFANGLFPVCAITHDIGLRRLFDLATLLLLLDCRPGDRVLDLGAGPGFSSEMLARVGYDAVAVDPDRGALSHARRRVGFDASRIAGVVLVAAAHAERLPFRSASFDGVLGMNVLHHVSRLSDALVDIARILKPGCRAVFSEPGLDHLRHPDTQRAIREHHEDDKAFDVMAFLRTARERGFSDAMLAATLEPGLRLVRVEDVDAYRAGQHPSPHLSPHGVIEELRCHHPFAVLIRDGARPKTSRHPGRLQCRLHVEGVPAAARRGGRINVTTYVENTGDTRWLSMPGTRGGYVTLGCKLLDANGLLITDTLGRCVLPHDVDPGESVTVTTTFSLPKSIAPGEYELRFDLVDELRCWFADAGVSPPCTRHISVT
jgi:SAM-dependent methyltransferase